MSVSKKPIIGGIILAAIIGVVFVGAQINPDNPENEKGCISVRFSRSGIIRLPHRFFYDLHDHQTETASLPNLEEGTIRRLDLWQMGDSSTVRLELVSRLDYGWIR